MKIPSHVMEDSHIFKVMYLPVNINFWIHKSMLASYLSIYPIYSTFFVVQLKNQARIKHITRLPSEEKW